MVEFKRYNKYYVVKISDVDRYLTASKKSQFLHYLATVEEGRGRDGKDEHSYVVVNEAQPYAEKVWQLIQGQWEKDEQSKATSHM